MVGIDAKTDDELEIWRASGAKEITFELVRSDRRWASVLADGGFNPSPALPMLPLLALLNSCSSLGRPSSVTRFSRDRGVGK